MVSASAIKCLLGMGEWFEGQIGAHNVPKTFKNIENSKNDIKLNLTDGLNFWTTVICILNVLDRHVIF